MQRDSQDQEEKLLLEGVLIMSLSREREMFNTFQKQKSHVSRDVKFVKCIYMWTMNRGSCLTIKTISCVQKKQFASCLFTSLISHFLYVFFIIKQTAIKQTLKVDMLKACIERRKRSVCTMLSKGTHPRSFLYQCNNHLGNIHKFSDCWS